MMSDVDVLRADWWHCASGLYVNLDVITMQVNVCTQLKELGKQGKGEVKWGGGEKSDKNLEAWRCMNFETT